MRWLPAAQPAQRLFVSAQGCELGQVYCRSSCRRVRMPRLDGEAVALRFSSSFFCFATDAGRGSQDWRLLMGR